MVDEELSESLPSDPKDMMQDRIVLYFDICGFGAAVEESDGDTTKEQALFKILEFTQSLLQIDQSAPPDAEYFPDFKINVLSDCVFVSTELDHRALGILFYIVQVVHCRLLKEDTPFFVRGGIDYGRVHHDGNIIFGAPVVRAVKIEENSASYFRTMISDKIKMDIVDKADTELNLKDFLASDNNNEYYVDYLIKMRCPESAQSTTPMCQIIGNLQSISKDINFEHNDKLKKKYEWFQKYWNTKELPMLNFF